jgi:hypothetical protein
MRQWQRTFAQWALLAVCIVILSGCASAQKSTTKETSKSRRSRDVAAATPTYETTPMPTVPPATATPVSTPAPIRTRPAGSGKTAGKGQTIGPLISFFGAARADGTKVEPTSVDSKGVPTYVTAAGSGFMLVIEAKPGDSELEVGRRVFAYVPDDPTIRPDLEIQSTRDMGNGSAEVCDRRRPNIGGIPGINPPSFAENKRVSSAINDFSCRFETFIESESSCTMGPNGDYSFINPETTTQFCMIVARAYAFPVGDTVLSVRVRDTEGNPGPMKQIRIRRPPSSEPAAK